MTHHMLQWREILQNMISFNQELTSYKMFYFEKMCS